MKTIITIVSMMFITLSALGAGHADGASQDQLLEQYIQYLKQGDTQGLLSILADPLLNRKKEQLQSNPSYSSFLVKYYDQADIRVLAVDEVDAQTSKAFLEVVFPGSAKPHEIKLLLKRLDGQWKIVDELN